MVVAVAPFFTPVERRRADRLGCVVAQGVGLLVEAGRRDAAGAST